MLISNIINDISLLTRQLRFYCWPYRRTLDQRQRQELIEILHEQHFERLANKIKSLNQSVTDSRQQIGQLLFEHCLVRSRRHQIIQLIESKLVDINVPLDNYSRTLLHRAAYNLDVELVGILIEHGVDIRARDFSGNTALHIAIQSYRNGAVIYGDGPDVVQNLTSIIKLLLEADKKLQTETPNGEKIISNPDRSMDIQLSEQRGSDIINGLLTKRKSSYKLVPAHFGGEPMLPRQNSAKNFGGVIDGKHHYHNEPSSKLTSAAQRGHEFTRQTDDSTEKINPISLEDPSSKAGPLIDRKNSFGRTALHYCVLVVGEQHLAHFVELLISYGADTNATDTRMRAPLYCLVKRPGIAAIRQKCLAITHLLKSGCDDLGLAIIPEIYFSEEFLKNLEKDISNLLQSCSIDSPTTESIFPHSTFKRVPRLKHLTRLRLIRLQAGKSQLRISLPKSVPATLNLYINRMILDQSELF